jgi:hypothetical protein
MPQPSLRPQDVLILCKLLSYRARRPPMARMGVELSISSSEVHAALKRLGRSGLVSSDLDGNRPLLGAVEEFLVHGVKYAFPAKRGEITRGLPTSYAAPPLNKHIEPGPDLPPVWPFPEGTHRGVSLEPLYRTVPMAAQRDEWLYEMLALIDALRDGRARERKLAEKELIARLRGQPDERSQSHSPGNRR